MMTPRQKALESGSKTYIGEKQCKHGHINPERQTSNRSCLDCQRTEDGRLSRSIRNINYRFNPNNHEKVKAKQREYYHDPCRNEEIKEKNKKHYSRPEIKELARVNGKEYRKKNKEKVLARNVWRKQSIGKRTPPWANKEAIEKFYKEAKELTESTGVKHHVDHIIPLHGKIVSGLHVETNLRVIPCSENLFKSNKLIEELICQ